MASNFSFSPMGLTYCATVGGATPVTMTIDVRRVSNTATLAVTGGNYPATGVRVANVGTAAMYLVFGSSGTNLTSTPSIGFPVMPNSVETFNIRGQSVVAAVCASTFTVTASFTPGEGL